MKLLKTILLLIVGIGAFAQEGIVRGTVIDGSTMETIPGAMIYLANNSGKGTVTDLDGKFSLKLSGGVYNLTVSYISYKNQVINNIKVTPGQLTLLNTITLESEATEMDELVITGKQSKNLDVVMLNTKKKSANLLDGISSESMSKIGDPDLASSMKRVPGVSITGGKYVYVRGLGDRYTKTILNGMEIPGLDPDRNSLQMDIFPSNIISNIIVYKTFDASLPADFTGGVVDISLLDFPDKKHFNISVGLGYDPGAHFNSNYLSYEGSKTDFLGFDDGTRAMPEDPYQTVEYVDALKDYNKTTKTITGEDGEAYYKTLHNFSPTMSAKREMSLMNFGFDVSAGNQRTIGKYSIGYNVALSYKNNTEYFEDVVNANYVTSPDKSVYTLEKEVAQEGDYGVNSVLTSALGGISIKKNNSKVGLTVLHLQNGESKAGIFDWEKPGDNNELHGILYSLDYTERSLTNILLNGSHLLTDGHSWKFVWKLSPTFSSVNNPDVRTTPYKIGDEGQYILNTEGGLPTRIWRDLSEKNLSGLFGFTKEFEMNNKKAKLNFGASYTYKQRDYAVYGYQFIVDKNLPLTGNPDELFEETSLWPNDTAVYHNPTFDPYHNPNQFDASINNAGVYLSTELSLTKSLRAIAGLRVEYYTQYYTGVAQSGSSSNSLDNEQVLNEVGFFPTLNLVQSVTDKFNLRASYSKTIARPSFKEMSYAEIQDPISGKTFIGGLHPDEAANWDGNLKTTDIHNFDARFEGFLSGLTASVSGFYKYLIDPIEYIQYTVQPGSYQPRNVGNAKVKGLECEMKLAINKYFKKMPEIDISGNYTYAMSSVELTDIEYNSKVLNARDGETISKERAMAGQAPHILNAGISMNITGNGLIAFFETGIYYNVQGRTLQYVGIANKPDIYSEPFHSLNWNSSFKMGKQKRMKLGFKISNILNRGKVLVYESYNGNDEYYSKQKSGRVYTVKLSYTLK